jgi:uncharacterized protein
VGREEVALMNIEESNNRRQQRRNIISDRKACEQRTDCKKIQ